MVLRDETLRPSILQNLRTSFKLTAAYKLEEDLNEVIMCAVDDIAEKNVFNKFGESSDAINRFFKKNHAQEIEDALSDLKINK